MILFPLFLMALCFALAGGASVEFHYKPAPEKRTMAMLWAVFCGLGFLLLGFVAWMGWS